MAIWNSMESHMLSYRGWRSHSHFYTYYSGYKVSTHKSFHRHLSTSSALTSRRCCLSMDMFVLLLHLVLIDSMHNLCICDYFCCHWNVRYSQIWDNSFMHNFLLPLYVLCHLYLFMCINTTLEAVGMYWLSIWDFLCTILLFLMFTALNSIKLHTCPRRWLERPFIIYVLGQVVPANDRPFG